MYSTLPLGLVLTTLFFFQPVHASVYVINPSSTTTCEASKKCTIEWLDDGTQPLLGDIGACTVGLFTGQEKLIQTLPPVDVATVHSLTFTPDPKAGPNSDTYYVVFTSTTLKDTKNNGTGMFQAFSPDFRLSKMTGTFAHPIPSDTATHPLPASLLLVQRASASSSSANTSTSTTSTKKASTKAATTTSSTTSSTSTSGTPTTPLVYPTPSGTVSSDNHNAGVRAHVSSATVFVVFVLVVLLPGLVLA